MQQELPGCTSVIFSPCFPSVTLQPVKYSITVRVSRFSFQILTIFENIDVSVL